jgi:hypothetical protein
MPDTIPVGPYTTAGHAAGTAVIERGWFQHLQALEDAIAYRRARASAPCPDCTASGRKCDDHSCAAPHRHLPADGHRHPGRVPPRPRLPR